MKTLIDIGRQTKNSFHIRRNIQELIKQKSNGYYDKSLKSMEPEFKSLVKNEMFTNFIQSNHGSVSVLNKLISKSEPYVQNLEVTIPLMVMGFSEKKIEGHQWSDLNTLTESLTCTYFGLQIHETVQEEIDCKNQLLAILIGDFLLTKGNFKLAELNDPSLIYLINDSVVNYVQHNFNTNCNSANHGKIKSLNVNGFKSAFKITTGSENIRDEIKDFVQDFPSTDEGFSNKDKNIERVQNMDFKDKTAQDLMIQLLQSD